MNFGAETGSDGALLSRSTEVNPKIEIVFLSYKILKKIIINRPKKKNQVIKGVFAVCVSAPPQVLL